MQLELLDPVPLPNQFTIDDVLHGTVVRDICSSDKRLIMKVKPTGFLLSSPVVVDVLNIGDCFVVDMAEGTLYAVPKDRAVLPLHCKLQYRPTR